MRLHLDSSVSGTSEPITNPTASAGSASLARAGAAGGLRDTVSISGTAAALNQFASERASRIQQISEAVRSGTYRVSSAIVAEAIVSQARK